MNITVLHNLVEAYQKARHWKLKAEGLQHKLQTLQAERELSRQKVQTLERDLSVLKYNLMCKACRHYWDTLNDGGTFPDRGSYISAIRTPRWFLLYSFDRTDFVIAARFLDEHRPWSDRSGGGRFLSAEENTWETAKKLVNHVGLNIIAVDCSSGVWNAILAIISSMLYSLTEPLVGAIITCFQENIFQLLLFFIAKCKPSVLAQLLFLKR